MGFVRYFDIVLINPDRTLQTYLERAQHLAASHDDNSALSHLEIKLGQLEQQVVRAMCKLSFDRLHRCR